jgi:hypothetical protein
MKTRPGGYRLPSLFLLLCLLAPRAEAQKSQEALRLERLTALGKLWGTIKFLHPYLAYQEIDWDAALIAAIPQVSAATTAEEYSAALQGMLAVLHDPGRASRGCC